MICNTAFDADLADRYYIGMMSGTSLDALDAVLCDFDGDTPKIIATHSKPFCNKLRAILLALCTPNGISHLDMGEFDGFSELDFWGLASRLYGEFASEIVNELIAKTNLRTNDITAIGCHGQTVRHRPNWRFSLQLLDPNILAERTGVTVVSDFRRRDMAVGGQGAPLVPAFHQAMFGNDQSIKAVLNLGGIANITLLDYDGQGTPIGFDTGVANLLMDAWIARHTGTTYDKDGTWAAEGQVIEPLLELLLNHPFFAKPPPKSTGREDFHLSWLDAMLGQLGHSHPNLRYSPVDVQTTLCELTAVSAAEQIARLVDSGVVLVCGGGAKNAYLMARLQAHLPNLSVKPTSSLGIDVALVEGMAFAWLARQNILGRTGNIPAVTGASKAVVLGQVCF